MTEQEDKPILVGTLNRELGYVGFKRIPIGSNVYEYKSEYIIERELLNGEKGLPVRFYKEQFKSYIDFKKEPWDLRP